MTFQVALIGSDGLIVASDRKQSIRDYDDDEPYSQPGVTHKFIKGRGIVCAFAGSAEARQLAMAISESPLRPSNGYRWHEEVRRIHREVEPRSSMKDDILVIEGQNLRQLELVSRRREPPSFTPINTWTSTGNNSIPARFLLQHFWSERPVSELKDLALLTLYCATKEDPSCIGDGIDLMTLTDSGFNWHTPYDPEDGHIVSLWKSFEVESKKILFPHGVAKGVQSSG